MYNYPDSVDLVTPIKGLAASMNQYWDCRDKLRVDHFRMWVAYLNFVPDVYANLGGGSSGI